MITVLGSLNMDLFIETESLPRPGETVPGTNFRASPGGKGANQAVAVARMGVAVAMLGAVGSDAFGSEMVAQLAALGVGTRGIARRAGIASGTAIIVVDAQGQNQIVVAPGANGTLIPDDVLRHESLIRRSNALLAQLETPLNAVESGLRVARKTGVMTVLNPAPAVVHGDELLRLCDWIIPNETEAARLSGVEVRSSNEAANAARIIRERSDGEGVAITLGERGVWLEHSTWSGHMPAFEVEAVDAVGAGDAFIGVFVARLGEGDAPREAARFASAAAAIAVTRRGAQAGIPTRAEVETFLKCR